MKFQTKRVLCAVALAVLLSMMAFSVVLADSYANVLAFTVADTSGSARTYVPVILPTVTQANLYSAGYATAAGTDLRAYTGSTALPTFTGTTKIACVIPSLSAYGSYTCGLRMGYVPAWTTQGVIPGDAGYVTTTDNAALEPASSFELALKGYYDTSEIRTGNNNPLYKTGAVRIQTPFIGKLQFVYDDYTAAITQAAATGTIVANTTTEVGQTFTATADTNMAQLVIYGTGTPTLCPVTLYSTAAGVPDAALATMVYPVFANGSTTINFPYRLTNGVVYAWGVYTGTSTYTMNLSNADPYAGGAEYTRTVGGAWSEVAGSDMKFVVNTAPWVMATVASGLHDFKTTFDGATLTAYVDDVVSDTFSTVTAVPNTANGWIWQAKAMPYMTWAKLTVSAVQQLWYEPNALIASTVLPNRAVVGSYNGAITFGSNSSLTVTTGAITSYQAVASTGEGDPTVPAAGMPGNWFATGTGAALPFFSDFSTAATSMGISTQSLYIVMMVTVAIAVGLMAGVFTGSWLIGTIGTGVMILAGSTTGVIPVWFVFVFAVLGAGTLYLTRQV